MGFGLKSSKSDRLLAFKITFMVLLLFLCSIWMLTLFISNRLEHELTAQMEAQQFASVSYIADSIDSQAKLRINSLTAVASRITPQLIAHPDKLREFLHNSFLLLPLFQTGVEVISREGIGIADYPVLRGRAGGLHADLDFINEVFSTGKPAVGKPRIGRFSQKGIIPFAVPVLTPSGRVIAVLAGYTFLSDPAMLGSIESAEYKGFRDRLVLVSPKYRIIITGSDPTRTMTKTPEPGVNPLSDRFLAGFEGSGIAVNSRGIRLLLSAKQIPTAGWYIRMGLPTEIAFAPIRSMKNLAYSIALGLSLVSSLLVWLVIRRGLNPLFAASKLIHNMAERQLPPLDIPITRNDEVGQLLASFNIHINYRRQVEEALRESRQRLAYAMNLAQLFDWIYDVERGLFVFSDRYYALHGTTSELEGGNLLSAETFANKFVHPDDAHMISEEIAKAVATADPDYHAQVETRIFRRDGELRHVSVHIAVIKDAAGRTIQVHGANQDITQRKQAAMAQHESESAIRALYATMTEGLATHDIVYSEEKAVDYIITDVNPTYEKITGMTRAAVLGRKASEIYGSETPPYLDVYARVASRGKPENFETYFPPMKKYFSISVFSPRKGRFATLFVDISDRKLAEIYGDIGREVLQILNEPGDIQDSLQRILSTLKTRTEFDAVGIRLQDKDDFPYVYQEGFSEDFLLTENTLIERAVDGGICRDKDGCVKLECTCGLVICDKSDPASPFFTAGGSFWTNDSSPLLNIPPSEDPRLNPRNECIHQGYASVALIPIRDKNRIIGLIQLNDRQKGRFSLNRVKMLEGIASHIGAALMRKKAEQDKTTLEAQLHQSQKMESIGILAGGVAHDFNNILMAIASYGYMAKQMLQDDTTTLSYIEEILDSANRAAELTRGLLAFSRKQVIAPVLVDLNEIIRKIEKMLGRIIREDINLSTVLSPGELPVLVDSGQIEQVLINLATNARDAMPDGGDLVIKTNTAQRFRNDRLKANKEEGTQLFSDVSRFALYSLR
jgi:PAS domain S-box-containing protein